MYEPPCRNTASALLPWYLNGALHGDQHATVREHVEGCDVCASELEDLEVAKRRATFPKGPPRLTIEGGPPETARPESRLGWILAVVVAVPAILGLVWVLLGVVGAR